MPAMAPIPRVQCAIASTFVAGRRAFGDSAANEDLHQVRPGHLDAVPFADMLAFLREKYGLQDAVVRQPLSELAQILGYRHVEAGTTIQFGDMGILMEEVGADPVSRREFRRFLRRSASNSAAGEQVPSVAAGLGESGEQEDLEAWFRYQNAKDLLMAVRKCGAAVESLPQGQGWLRVTTPGGAVIRFKQVGKKARARGEGGHKERPMSDKKIEIRACPEAEDPISGVMVLSSIEDTQESISKVGPRLRRVPSRTMSAAAVERPLLPRKGVNLRVREPRNTGRGLRPRRRARATSVPRRASL